LANCISYSLGVRGADFSAEGRGSDGGNGSILESSVATAGSCAVEFDDDVDGDDDDDDDGYASASDVDNGVGGRGSDEEESPGEMDAPVVWLLWCDAHFLKRTGKRLANRDVLLFSVTAAACPTASDVNGTDSSHGCTCR
jgi:hypothetical protein